MTTLETKHKSWCRRVYFDSPEEIYL